MRSISGISSWQSPPPRASGPARTDALVPVAPIQPSRRPSQETAEPPTGRAVEGEYLVASALPPIDFGRRVFDTLTGMAAAPDDANAGLAIRAMHAYLLAAAPMDAATGLQVDGYA